MRCPYACTYNVFFRYNRLHSDSSVSASDHGPMDVVNDEASSTDREEQVQNVDENDEPPILEGPVHSPSGTCTEHSQGQETDNSVVANVMNEATLQGPPVSAGQSDGDSSSGSYYDVETDNSSGSVLRRNLLRDPYGIRDGDVKDLAREWILRHMGRICSNEVANDLFDFAWDYCDVFLRHKLEHGGRQIRMRELRKKVTKEHVPKVDMDFIYEDLSLPEEQRPEQQVHVMNCTVMPRKRFPPETHDLISQVTRVSVIRNQTTNLTDFCLISL